jgi:hypothetical protein
MEFLQKEVGALLQDCEDTRENVLQADESATEEAAEPTLAAAAAQNCFELHQATVVLRFGGQGCEEHHGVV